jgi:hypothetical protein
MARSASHSGETVFIPEPGVHVQTAATEEDPGGRVYHLTHGWVEIPPELATNSVIKNLVPKSEAEKTRAMALFAADRKRQEMLSQVAVDYYAESTKIDEAALEAMRGEEESRAKRIEEDAARGITRSEPHPDPDAQRSISLTADAMYHMVSAAGMSSKHPDETATSSDTTRTTLPTCRAASHHA